MTDDELLAMYPGFTLDQIKRGLSVPAVEMAAWDRRLHEHERSIYGDALSIGAAEYIAAEDQAEPYWKGLLGLLCCFAIVAMACVLIYALGG